MGVVLLGYRGSGKTSVGIKLADRLWSEFVDTDQEIVRRTKRSITDIFAQDGEEAFRDLESQVLADMLKRESDVIACGGGIILRESNRELLKACPHSRVYLRCEPDTLYKRIHDDPSTPDTRPPLTGLGGGLEEIRSLMASREPLYREVMTTELEVTNLDIDEVVVRVTKLV